MGAKEFIKIKEFCITYDIEESFVFDLERFEVIQTKLIKDESYLPEKELPVLEKMIRMHQDLEINVQGLQAVYHLLEKVSNLQEEIIALRRRVNRIEN